MNAEIREDAQCEWSLYYETSLDEQYNYDLAKLLTYFEIFRIARKTNDELTAFVALLHAGTSSQNLKSLFENIENEIDKVMFRDPRFTWPDIPEGYKFPEDYLEEKS